MRRAQFSQLPNRIAAQPYPLSSSGAASHATALLANVQAAGAPLHKTAVHAVRVLEGLLLRVAWWAEAVLSSPYFALYQHTSTAIAQFAAEASFDVALKGNKMALPTLMASYHSAALSDATAGGYSLSADAQREQVKHLDVPLKQSPICPSHLGAYPLMLAH